MLALVFMVGSLPELGARLHRALEALAPKNVTPGNGHIAFTNGVPWASLTIDGHPLDVPATGAGTYPQTLAPGRHTLSYAAAPFQLLECHLSVPARVGDTCPLALAAQSLAAPGTLRVIDLRSTPERLSAQEYARLVASIEASLPTYTSHLALGETYLNVKKKVVVARTPLIATLRYLVNTDPNYDGFVTNTDGGIAQRCISVCVDQSNRAGTGDPTRWHLVANVYAAWTYTTLSGQVIIADAPATISNQNRDLLLVSVGYNGTWQLDAAAI
jgi:hypothetical protein